MVISKDHIKSQSVTNPPSVSKNHTGAEHPTEATLLASPLVPVCAAPVELSTLGPEVAEDEPAAVSTASSVAVAMKLSQAAKFALGTTDVPSVFADP